MDRNFKISIIQATGSDIRQVITFRQLVKFMLTNPEAIRTGKLLADLHDSDPVAYNREKQKQPGFIIGEFSYRSTESCIQYEPVLGFDIDHIPDSEQYSKIFEKVQRWPFTFVAMPSISQAGIRVLVYSDCTEARHKEYYSFAAASLSALLGIPTKSKIRKSLRALDYHNDYIKDFLSKNIHIDDATNDTSRFWYYSGLTKSQLYVNQESEVLTIQPKEEKPAPTAKPTSSSNGQYPYTYTDEDKVSYLVEQIERNRIDITQGVPEWFTIGLALYDAFGDMGEDYFIRVSQFHQDFDDRAAQREWGRVRSKFQPGRVTIASFYQWCKDYGVGIDYDELKVIHADKFPTREPAGQIETPKPKPTKPNLDLEAAILATCIKKPEFIPTIFDTCPKFTADCFATNQGRIVFGCIQRLMSDGMTVSPVSVRAKLEYTDLDAEKTLEIYQAVRPSGEDFSTNIRLLYAEYLKRRVIELNQAAMLEVQSEDVDVFDFLSTLYGDLNALSDYGSSTTISNAFQLAQTLLARYDLTARVRRENGSTLTGSPTGLSDLDRLTGGYQPTDLIITAARPGMGKTSKALGTAIANVRAGHPVGLCSLEMSAEQLGQRAISLSDKIELQRIRKAELSESEYSRFYRAAEAMSDWPLYIDDKGGASISHIEMTARKWVRQHGIKLLIIDYLQLITGNDKKQDRNRQIGSFTKALKSLAKELKIPIILLSQLSRAVETRGGDKRPSLADLRDSGEIEEDADMVEFIYRPEYYQILEDAEGNSLKATAEIIVAKHRNGPLDTIQCGFDAKYTEFFDGERYEATATDYTELEKPIPTYNATAGMTPAGDDDEIPF